MPVLAYFGVVGSLLLGLLYLAEAKLGPPTALAVSTEFHGLPAPWKSKNSVQILTARNAPAPDMPAARAAEPAAPPALEPPKKTRHAGVPKKKKTARAAPQDGSRNRYAQSGAGPHQSYGTVW